MVRMWALAFVAVVLAQASAGCLQGDKPSSPKAPVTLQAVAIRLDQLDDRSMWRVTVTPSRTVDAVRWAVAADDGTVVKQGTNRSADILLAPGALTLWAEALEAGQVVAAARTALVMEDSDSFTGTCPASADVPQGGCPGVDVEAPQGVRALRLYLCTTDSLSGVVGPDPGYVDVLDGDGEFRGSMQPTASVQCSANGVPWGLVSYAATPGTWSVHWHPQAAAAGELGGLVFYTLVGSASAKPPTFA